MREAANKTQRRDGAVTSTINEMGPVGYLVVEFPGNRMTGEGFPILVDLVDRGLIRIIDLAFVSKDTDGKVLAMELSDLDLDGALELKVFEGASSGVLGAGDLQDAAEVIEPGSSAGVLVYENKWAAPFASALRRGGGQLVAHGTIPLDALAAALDENDPVR